MRNYTDEQLVAYADGELEASLAREIDVAAAADPALARRIGVFTGTHRLLARVFETKKVEPVPDALLDLLEGRTGLRAQRLADPARVHRLPWRPLALAASLVVALGLGLVLRDSQGPAGFEGHGPDPLEIARALETHYSGVPAVTMAGGLRTEIVPLSTLRHADGRWCREFETAEIADGQLRKTRGVACRDAGAHWQVLALAHAEDGPGAAPEGGYRPASSPREELRSLLGPVRPLRPTEEEALIRADWDSR